jgi:hypothetical protein
VSPFYQRANRIARRSVSSAVTTSHDACRPSWVHKKAEDRGAGTADFNFFFDRIGPIALGCHNDDVWRVGVFGFTIDLSMHQQEGRGSDGQVFELDDAGKIKLWGDYFDLATFIKRVS